MTARGIDEEQIKRVINYGSKVKQTYGCKAVYTYISVAYFDETLEKPLLFTSRVEGTLISEARGNSKNPLLKSQLGLAFIIKGQNKTLAEMTSEDYNKYARSDRWEKLAEYLKNRPKD